MVELWNYLAVEMLLTSIVFCVVLIIHCAFGLYVCVGGRCTRVQMPKKAKRGRCYLLELELAVLVNSPFRMDAGTLMVLLEEYC